MNNRYTKCNVYIERFDNIMVRTLTFFFSSYVVHTYKRFLSTTLGIQRETRKQINMRNCVMKSNLATYI